MAFWNGKDAKHGMKVKCVTKGPKKPDNWPNWIWDALKVGKIYTVDAVYPPIDSNPKAPNFVSLKEIAPSNSWQPLPQLDCRGFEPVRGEE